MIEKNYITIDNLFNAVMFSTMTGFEDRNRQMGTGNECCQPFSTLR
jgi:hypothetical protein